MPRMADSNMISISEVVLLDGKNGTTNCMSTTNMTATSIEANLCSNSNSSTNNSNKQQQNDKEADTTNNNNSNAANDPNRSQVSSDNENSSNHSAIWSNSGSSKRGAQKRLEAAQKLNLILPQQEPPLQKQQQQQQKNCLSTPIVITGEDLHLAQSQAQAYGHFYPSASQQMLFDSLAHQFNGQGGEVSLFTGLPSCTPTSADRLTSINPFFLHATTSLATPSNQTDNAENSATNNNDQLDQTRSIWAFNGHNNHINAAEHNHNQEKGVAAGAPAPTAANKQSAPPPPPNAYSANNYGGNHQANNNHHHLEQQRSKLILADLHAASALSPIILSPLSFLGLSPEQEALLRYGYVSPQQHPLAGRGFTQNDLNQLSHCQQVYHLNQIYHAQLADQPINTHQYAFNNAPHNHNHHLHLHHTQQQQQNHLSHDQQQQQRLQQPAPNQNQVATDLTQQSTPVTTVNQHRDLCTPVRTSTVSSDQTGHVYHNQQQPGCTNIGRAQIDQQPHNQPGHTGERQLADSAHEAIDHARAQHFVSAIENNNQQAQREEPQSAAVVRGRNDGPASVIEHESNHQQVPMTVSVSPALTIQSTPVIRAGQLGRPQLLGQAQTSPHRHQQQQQQHQHHSGLLVPTPGPVASTHGNENEAATLGQFAAYPRATAKQAGHPTIVLHESPPSRPLQTPPRRISQLYPPGSGLEQQARVEVMTKLARQASFAEDQCRVSPSECALDNSVASIASTKGTPTTNLGGTTTPLNEAAPAASEPNEQLDATSITTVVSTTISSTNDLSCPPMGRLAIVDTKGRPNSCDNLVSDHHQETFGVAGRDIQDRASKSLVVIRSNSSSIASNNDSNNNINKDNKTKPKQRKAAKNTDSTQKEDQQQQTATPLMATIQNGTGEVVLVKKKSRGGRKKKIITHEEMLARKNRSKERNRVAARRCRQKRKQFLDELRDKIDHLHELNQGLRKENSLLKSELEAIKRHHSACRI